MKVIRRLFPSPAMVVACIALLVAPSAQARFRAGLPGRQGLPDRRAPRRRKGRPDRRPASR
jgi:hypothetical protein